jgi:hypothetical protein
MFLVSSVAEIEAVLADYNSGRLTDARRTDDPLLSDHESAQLASRCG